MRVTHSKKEGFEKVASQCAIRHRHGIIEMYSYESLIGVVKDDTILWSSTYKYSSSTSRHRSKILSHIGGYSKKQVTPIEENRKLYELLGLERLYEQYPTEDSLRTFFKRVR